MQKTVNLKANTKLSKTPSDITNKNTTTTTKTSVPPVKTNITSQGPAKKLRPNISDDLAPAVSGPSTTSEPKNLAKTYTHSELWRWTLTKDALAPCRVHDIFEMKECENTKAGTDPDFFWLGRVPCRSVMFYGVVVGVTVYEQRVLYTVDDGSGKIDCNLRAAPPAPVPKLSPKKQTQKPSSSSSSSVLSKYRLNGGRPMSPPKKPRSTTGPTISLIPGAPKPVATVGDIVRATGRVLNRHRSRLVNLDSITLCKNATEEPLHWLAVRSLHQTWYNPPDNVPFVIPEPTPITVTTTGDPFSGPSTLTIPEQFQHTQFPSAPSSPSKSSIASSSAPTSPSSSTTRSESATPSSRHSTANPASPPRLRHPSRLHMRDLTANTFRIYVKHYMDNAPRERARSAESGVSSASEDEHEDGAWGGGGSRVPGTPTKPHRSFQAGLSEMTPRPGKLVGMSSGDVNQTPRAVAYGARPRENSRSGIRGYTLSHLRRVPELVLLARRVVEAEAKRRAREEKRKREDATSVSQLLSSSSTSRTHRASASSASASSAVSATSTALRAGKGGASEPASAKMKRLFRYAIRQLYEEGSIVIWDGPTLPAPEPNMNTRIPQPSFSPSAISKGHDNSLWKYSSSSISVSTVSSVSQHSSATGTAWTLEDDLADLSDPRPDEEAYIPLSPSFLARIVEGAIVELMSRPRRPGVRANGAPQPGPTVDEIVAYLHKKDARWARIGEWAVKDALEWASGQGRVWCIGGGRWEVCG